MPVSRADLDRVSDFIHGLRDARNEEFHRMVKTQAIMIAGTAAWLAYRKFGRGR